MLQQIYLQDCGSTHGTYIDKRRLETGVDTAVVNGVIITFGQRVTSGAGGFSFLQRTLARRRSADSTSAVTYPAKEFRLNSKWELPRLVLEISL